MSSESAKKPVYGFQSPEAAEFPPMVILENTTVCNLRCIHCPQGQGYPEHPDYRAVFMDWDIYRKAIDEIAENKIILLRFSSDGEALLHRRFLDQIAYAKAKKISPVNLTTNGVLLDNPAVENGKPVAGKTIMERLLELGLDIIDISLDAANRKTYETIRVRSNYHRVWSNVHRLLYLRDKLKAPTKVMLSIVDQPESHDEVADFIKYWTPLVDRVLVRGYIQNLGLTPSRDGMSPTEQEPQRWPCPQFWKRVSINPEGGIRFCTCDWMNKTVVGNIKTHSIKQLWKGAEYDRLRKAHLEGRYADARPICGPCVDWKPMRWEWGFEVAVKAVTGQESSPANPPGSVPPNKTSR